MRTKILIVAAVLGLARRGARGHGRRRFQPRAPTPS